ncbi:hypothetical protein GCK72_017696 [Caenorhabditis remanei]|uniref:Uncharacterized protein n=1 Tax=Caenorhabditis remanei TaxID=31234 RepID=A0A6A5G979_CAERE|nr:hypothetical protein GCK72_017696 [Caenorhabditis remanei]KAF1751142.1 hypothetical protein GCK72_017696 [Caenorhabditis remanei]
MSSTQNNEMKTFGYSEPDYTSNSYPSTSSLGRTRTFGSERSLNSEDTLHNVPSLIVDTLSSLSGRNRGAHSSNVVVDEDVGEDRLKVAKRKENINEKSDPSNDEERSSKRQKLDVEDNKIEITLGQLQEMEIKGTVLRPIYSEKLSELRRINLEKMFDPQNASLPTIIVSKTDTNKSQAISMVMFDVEDGVFSSAWPHCLSLKFSESFTSESSVSSRVELSLIPSHTRFDALHFQISEKDDQRHRNGNAFFFQNLPKDDIPLMITKKLDLIIAEPSGETINHLMGRWADDQITTTILNSSAYDGQGQNRTCLLCGGRLLKPESRESAPNSSW